MNVRSSLDNPNTPEQERLHRSHGHRSLAGLGHALMGVALMCGLQLFLGDADTAFADTRMGATYETTLASQDLGVGSSLDMRDEGYNSSYIFGMTKGVSSSTIIPAIKPLFFLITIPLDLVTLPFAAIGGFF